VLSTKLASRAELEEFHDPEYVGSFSVQDTHTLSLYVSPSEALLSLAIELILA
jgi:hypothetical protein